MTDLRSPTYRRFLILLKRARIDAELHQREAAAMLGLPQSFVAKCELGRRRVDALELAAFATVYNKPMTYFIPSVTRLEDLLK